MYYAPRGYGHYIYEFRDSSPREGLSENEVQSVFANVVRRYFQKQEDWRREVAAECQKIDLRYAPNPKLYISPEVDKEANKRWRKMVKAGRAAAADMKRTLEKELPYPDMDTYLKLHDFHRIKVTEVDF